MVRGRQTQELTVVRVSWPNICPNVMFSPIIKLLAVSMASRRKVHR